MERASRRIEFAQGWQVEENTWSEVDSSGKIVQKPFSQEKQISPKIKDAENLTGEQSALRKAREVLKNNAIKDLSNWEELHTLMHSKGMEYRKKGSGAVIHVGDITLKASSVSRGIDPLAT